MHPHAKLSFSGFTTVRHYSQLRCFIILFVLLLLFLLLLLCPLYILTNNNGSANTNIRSSTLRNKLSENLNIQRRQEVLPPQTLYADHRSVDRSIGDAFDGTLVVNHNNLPKSRIGGGNYVETITNHNSMADIEPSKYSKSEAQINSGVNSKLNIANQGFVPLNLCKRRNKRVIIFSGGGVVKFVVGVSFPINLGDKQRSLSYFYNLQGQFPPPMSPTYWWNYFNSSSYAGRRQQRKLNTDQKEKLHQRLKHDVSRAFLYAAIEQIYERHGIPGEACLLQAICEVSQSPFHVPRVWENKLGYLWHAVLNAVLIPTIPNIDMKYLHASEAGRFGADCQQAFSECPEKDAPMQRKFTSRQGCYGPSTINGIRSLVLTSF